MEVEKGLVSIIVCLINFDWLTYVSNGVDFILEVYMLVSSKEIVSFL